MTARPPPPENGPAGWHSHKWRKVAGEPKVYCRVKGCTVTLPMFQAGTKVPWTGKTQLWDYSVFTHNKLSRTKRVQQVARECFHCGKFCAVDKEGLLLKDHICDTEGEAQTRRAMSAAQEALNKFFFGGSQK